MNGLRLLGLILLALFCTPAHAEERVDLALVLAADISFSVGPYELDLQRRGYVQAFRSRGVIAAMTSGYHGRTAIAYLEWGDESTQHLILPWTIIDGPESAQAVAKRLENAPLYRSGETSISAALNVATKLFSSAPSAQRWVIDISSDGYNNDGGHVTVARDVGLRRGITINGLPIESEEGSGLTAYFRDCVIGGPGAFTIAVDGVEDFAPSLERKMRLEIADQNARIYRVAAPDTTDCQIGERKVREDYNRQLDDITNGKSERWRWREGPKQ
ncbi:MAG: DUF1194 domain-containing protein [Pseudomonadota bacterium]